MRWCTSGEGVETTARRYGLIDHNGLFRDHIPEERRNFVWIECPGGQCWREGLLHGGLLYVGTHRVCQAFERVDDVVFQGGERGESTALRG